MYIATSANQPLSVFQLFVKLKALFTEHVPARIYVRGQIADFSASAVGHWYFSIKDEKAQLGCVVFEPDTRRIRHRPKEGDMVVLGGEARFYERRGRFQLVAKELIQEGIGDLHRRYEELKQKLHQEGLFDASRKRPIPSLILRLCLITSRKGAALEDVQKILQRRMPCMRLSLIDARVQGEEAAEQIIDALRIANNLARFDTILITRGGGSAEDLWCFNDAKLARAIAASEIPVVSAVGHEIDTTLCDLVADKRSPTPSAAAEELSLASADQILDLAAKRQRLHRFLSERVEGFLQRNDELQRRMKTLDPIASFTERLQLADKHIQSGIRASMSERENILARLADRLHKVGPGAGIQSRQRLQQASLLLRYGMHRLMDTSQARLGRARTGLRGGIDIRMREEKRTLAHLTYRLNEASPRSRMQVYGGRLQHARVLLRAKMDALLNRFETRLATHNTALRAINPTRVLQRGYALALNARGDTIKDARSVKAGDSLQVRLARGKLDTQVQRVHIQKPDREDKPPSAAKNGTSLFDE